MLRRSVRHTTSAVTYRTCGHTYQLRNRKVKKVTGSRDGQKGNKVKGRTKKGNNVKGRSKNVTRSKGRSKKVTRSSDG